MTKSRYPQVGTVVKGKHHKQPKMPSYTYKPTDTVEALCSSIDASLPSLPSEQKADVLDQGGRLSYARIGDTRSDALARPVPAAPVDWRGWDDMRLRMSALQSAWRQNEPSQRSRAERYAQRVASRGSPKPEEESDIEEDIYN